MWGKAHRSGAAVVHGAHRPGAPAGGRGRKQEEIMEQRAKQSEGATSRRSFLRTGVAVGAGTIGVGLLANGLPAFVAEGSGGLTPGDAAILRFLAALETLETDL